MVQERTQIGGQVILETCGLTKSFGGLIAVNKCDLVIQEGSLRAIIGPNGAGKTTLFNLITGSMPVTSGKVLLRDINITNLPPERIARAGISRTFQLTSVFLNMTVSENVEIGVNSASGTLNPFASSRRSAEVRKKARELLERLGLGDLADSQAGDLSYGHQRILDIAVALSTSPKLLLLDEPTAGLSVKETATMVEVIKQISGKVTIIIIEHDMNVVTQVADYITVLVNGEKLVEGTPDIIASNQKVQDVYLGRSSTLKVAYKGD